MPTEHEYKYVLSKDILKQEPALSMASHEIQHIKQGYLAFSKGMTLRVRCITKGSSDGNEKKKWYMTLKQKVGERVIEIETKISDRDGKDLWSSCVGRLTKDRYVVPYNYHIWEVDFFLKGGQLYFVQAEVELDEGDDRPKEMPPLLKKHLIYEVPLTDDRFSNKRLTDVDYTHRLYKSLTEKQGE